MWDQPEHREYISAGAMTGTTVLGGTSLHVTGKTLAVFHCRWTDTSSGIGTFLVEGSNDDSNWITLNALIPKHPNAATDKCLIIVPCTTPHMRLKYTNTSGTGTLNVGVALHVSAVNYDAPPSSFVAGSNTGVDSTTAEQIVTADTPLRVGLWVQGDAANTGTIKVVVSGGTTGPSLAAGKMIFLPVDNANKVYVLASVDEENVNYWGS